MNRWAWVAVAVAMVTAVGCGSTREAGDDCEPENAGECANDTEVLVCNGGVLRAVPCRGPSGCTESSEQVVCDFSGARSGDACPRGSEGQALCSAGNPNLALLCLSGTFQAQTCEECVQQDGEILCAP
jgi:hypothetical protein